MEGTELMVTHFDHLEPFEPEDASKLRFRRQWIVAPKSAVLRLRGERRELNATHDLHYHADLRISGKDFGDGRGYLLLGLGVIPHRPDENFVDTLPHPLDDNDARIAAALHELAGTYVLLCYTPDSISLYTDPAAMMGVYYGDGMAASTPALLPNLRRNAAIDSVFPLEGTDNWYPGSLVPFHDVRALIANHRLDLATETIERFWPRGPATRRSKINGVREACDVMRGTIRAASRVAPLMVSLTGGRDSRVNLAASRELKDSLEYFTLTASWIKSCDVDCPVALAEQFDLSHRVIPIPPPPEWMLELYDEMVAGLSIGMRREIVGACRGLSSSGLVHLNGNLGAITKSYFWHSPRPTKVKRSALAKEFIRKPACILQGIDEWLETLPPGLSASEVYNLFYLEQRGGRWMGIGECASNLFYESLTPFNSRQVFEAVVGMPQDVQYGGTLLVDFVREMWPELLEVPYCPVTRNWGTYLPKGLKQWIRRFLGRV